MSHRYSHLVWLGAGTASTPAGIIDLADQVTLVEARKEACISLQKKFPQKEVNVIHQLITIDSDSADFIEYNLAEYSATQPPTGIKNLFPGLKKSGCKNLMGVQIHEAIAKLGLVDTNNILIIDIPDTNLMLLEALQKSIHLHKFSSIYVHTGKEPLYAHTSTDVEICAFLLGQGYLQQQIIVDDPDLPLLMFTKNPLLEKLLSAQLELNSVKIENDTIKEAHQQLKRQLINEQERLVQEHFKTLGKLKIDLDQTNKTAASRKDIIAKQEKDNIILGEINKELNHQINLLKIECLKAEAQIELIKDLMITR